MDYAAYEEGSGEVAVEIEVDISFDGELGNTTDSLCLTGNIQMYEWRRANSELLIVSFSSDDIINRRGFELQTQCWTKGSEPPVESSRRGFHEFLRNRTIGTFSEHTFCPWRYFCLIKTQVLTIFCKRYVENPVNKYLLHL